MCCLACTSPKGVEPDSLGQGGVPAADLTRQVAWGSYGFTLPGERVVHISVYKQLWSELESPTSFEIKVYGPQGELLAWQLVVGPSRHEFQLNPQEAAELCLEATPAERKCELLDRMLVRSQQP